jgi:hypothetical protein
MCRQSGHWNRYVSQGGVDTVRYKGVCCAGLRSALSELGTSAIWLTLIDWFCLAAEAFRLRRVT